MPTIPKRSGNALQELHCPLPTGNKAVRCSGFTAHRPQAVRQCVPSLLLPPAPIQ